MRSFCTMAAAGFVLLAASAGRTQSQLHTPPPGSAERKVLLNILRAPCERDLGQKVIFEVDRLNVFGDWSFARVTPRQPNGAAIDYRKTRFHDAFEAGAFDAAGEALLRRRNRAWVLLEWRFGATDTEVELWMRKYGTPELLFK